MIHDAFDAWLFGYTQDCPPRTGQTVHCPGTMPVPMQDTPEKNADLLEEAADPGDSEDESEQSLVPRLSPRLNSAAAVIQLQGVPDCANKASPKRSPRLRLADSSRSLTCLDFLL